MRVMKGTGRGVLKVPPDTTRLTITLKGTYPEYADALKHSAEDTGRLKDVAETLGFSRKDVKTLSFNIETEYESYRDKDGISRQRFQGYEFSHVMKLEFDNDNDLLGKTLYALAHGDLTPTFRISYTVKDPEAAKNELLRNAVKDATAKAEVLAQAAGVSLGEIQSIDYSWGQLNVEFKPMNQDMEWSSIFTAFGGGAVDFEPNDVEVSETVTVIWEIS